MKNFWRRLISGFIKVYVALRKFNQFFSKTEKFLIIILLIAATAGLVFWLRDFLRQSGRLSVSDMVYSEGWILNNPKIAFDFGRLTKAGLTRFGQDGGIVGDIADTWEESADHLTYTFHIRDSLTSSQLMGYIAQDKDTYGGAEASATDDHTLVLKLKQPLNYFLAITTEPIYPFGPYRVERQAAKTVTLISQQNYHLGRPKIGRVIIRLYKSDHELIEALEGGQILATASLTSELTNTKAQRVALPRFVSLFLNTRRPPFSDKSLRQKLVQGEDLSSQNLKITLVSSSAPEVDKELGGVVEKLEKQGINVEVVKQDSLTIMQDRVAKRDFDALLLGINYGYGEDLYPFWHSSQVKEPDNNFVGLQNKALDRNLEEIRITSDTNRRVELTAQAKEIIKGEYVELPIKEEVLLYQSSPRVENNTLGRLFNPLDRYGNIIEWTIKK